MLKLDMKTPNFTDENILKIAEIFPNCLTESIDDKGNLTKAIDFDLLRQELSANIVDGQRERYQINWPGKREALIKANEPINKTLRPYREESVNFDTTQNLYIEGDNLEALKLLQESYLGKIKMIYIDPPYNTGNDFIYSDNFDKDAKHELLDSGQINEEGGKLVSNPDSNGRYHSDWLSMIYPRLKLARNLLKDDGVIFISIDDNEITNLKKLCDEIFGESNFISQVTRIAKRTSNKGTYFRPTKDYVLVYTKNISLLPEFGIKKECDESDYKYEDDDGRMYKQSGASLYQPSLDSRPNQRYYIEAPDGSLIIPPGNIFPEEKKDGAKIKPLNNTDKVWRWSLDTYLKQKHLLMFTKGSPQNPLLDENGNQSKWNIYPKVYFDEDIDATLLPEDVIYNFPNSQGTKELKSLSIPFSFAKPTGLLSFLIGLLNDFDDSIILDFFSGSGTTAHATMKLNSEDNGNRKFIMVQLPEIIDEMSEAYKAGYKTIPEIGKERIRRAGKKILEENKDKEGIENLDIGFRVLKVDSSNMKDVYYTPDELSKESLFEDVENIKEDRKPEDILFQVLLDWGVDLMLPIVREEILGKTVFFVDGDTLAACFDDGIDEEFVKELAKREMMRVVFKDSGFKEDDTKSNVEQIFTQLSPDTEVRAI